MKKRLMMMTMSALLLPACHSADKPQTYGLAHEFGHIAEGPNQGSCSRQPAAPPYEDMYQYLADHITRIITANQDWLPARFRDPEVFCPVITPSSPQMELRQRVNASMGSTNQLNVMDGLLAAVETDASFAGTVAHEIAHALNHGITELHPSLRDDQVFLSIYYEMRYRFQKYNEFTLEQMRGSKTSLLYQTLSSLPGDTAAISRRFMAASRYQAGCSQYIDKKEQHRHKNHDITEIDYTALVRDDAPTDDADIASLRDQRRQLLADLGAQAADAFLDFESEMIGETQRTKRYFAINVLDIYERVTSYQIERIGREAYFNWMEADADEVGFELFLRAGYDKNEYTKLFDYVLRHDAKDPLVATSTSPSSLSLWGDPLAAHDLASEVDGCARGDDLHPALCWRIADIEAEWEKHREQYENLPGAQNPQLNVFGDRLAALKQKYQQP